MQWCDAESLSPQDPLGLPLPDLCVTLRSLLVDALALRAPLPRIIHAALSVILNFAAASPDAATCVGVEGGRRGPSGALLPLLLSFSRQCLDAGVGDALLIIAPPTLAALAAAAASPLSLHELCRVSERVFACASCSLLLVCEDGWRRMFCGETFCGLSTS